MIPVWKRSTWCELTANGRTKAAPDSGFNVGSKYLEMLKYLSVY